MLDYVMQDGVKYTTTGEDRLALSGEYYLSRNGSVLLSSYDKEHIGQARLILKKEKWKGVAGDTFFCLNDRFIVVECREYGVGGPCDTMHRVNNYFQTYEQAEEASIKIKALLAQ
jgi:hypothetical protein